jgi:hypothetical protein
MRQTVKTNAPDGSRRAARTFNNSAVRRVWPKQAEAEGRKPSGPGRVSRLQNASNRQNKHTGRLAPCRYEVSPVSSSIRSSHSQGQSRWKTMTIGELERGRSCFSLS